MRVIIAAAGSQHKWGGHLGVPSHLAPVMNEDGTASPLLHRTTRQALELTDDVHLTAPPNDPRYRVDGVTIHEQSPGFGNEYEASRHLWSDTTRTVLLLGDVFFSTYAMATLRDAPADDYRVFGRYGPSEVTGTPWGEIFAASWGPRNRAFLGRHLLLVSRSFQTGKSRRRGGWELLRSVQGTSLNDHRVLSPWFVEINDETDDIDFPADYARHPATKGLPQQ